MRKVTTILCSIAFMISGIMMAITAKNESSSNNYKTIMAATVQRPVIMPTFPSVIKDTSTFDLSEDLVRDLAKKKGVLDTVYVTKTDTIEEQVTKVKWRKVPVPSSVMEINVTAKSRTDTVKVPIYYLATQVGNKEGPNNECIPIYEVRKVDEICPNSSIELINKSDSVTGAEL